jgi:uncharacterized LabA/DUF88 family protein
MPASKGRPTVDIGDGYSHHYTTSAPCEYARSTILSVCRKLGAFLSGGGDMRMRRIAVLIDGGFFLKRLPKLVEPQYRTTAKQVADTARHLCKRHVQRLTHWGPDPDAEGLWLDHVYRLFYYDAAPYEGVSHHPIQNRRIDFGKSEVASFRRELFSELRYKRKFALRLGHVTKESDWRLSPRLTRHVLKIGKWLEFLEAALLQEQGVNRPALSDADSRELRGFVTACREIGERDVNFGLRQKGVDMRIGLDIASMTLKHQVDTLILVTGDSDFVPAAKLARREGVEFLLDPLWQQVSDELNEHVDGVVSAFPKPAIDSQARIAA